ncbi:Disulfide bond formation protein B [Candidatus Blochmanniella vafra str. BVAF]|uniref:Disulfide bond formation protein B n=1 Tax=Blochmanniella vafra (strain BVAF) TaxID=859654 RepID=E8Q704_BLOVB|nr:disulfide bond formation protein DsbB [Candidatus Blochmannia vafer]ADV33828.1 Disulfide bond formation protein B [Candidatus Blochmannia vafer str. BVAF]
MLYNFYIYSKSRKCWITLIYSIIGLISVALFEQYFLMLKPCVLCIYQRCALIGIAISGIIALISPNRFLFRVIAIIIWTYSAYKGLYFSIKHITTILYSSPFFTCDLIVSFPEWLPLNKWLPIMFKANGEDCSIHTWNFFLLNIHHWMFLIFISYLFVVICIIIAHFMRIYKHHYIL